MKASQLAGWLLLIPCTALLCGCGRQSLLPVTAVVKLDGRPLSNVLVTFVPMSSDEATPFRSMGATDANGQAKLQAESGESGAVTGKHRVIIEDLAVLDAPRSEDGTVLAMPERRFPSLYSDLARSPLTAEIAANGQQTIQIELNSR